MVPPTVVSRARRGVGKADKAARARCAHGNRAARKEGGFTSVRRHRARAPVMHLEESGIPAATPP